MLLAAVLLGICQQVGGPLASSVPVSPQKGEDSPNPFSLSLEMKQF